MNKFIYTNDQDTAKLLGRYFTLLSSNNGTHVFINDENSKFYKESRFNNKTMRTSNILTF